MKAMQQNENFKLPRRLQGVQPTLIRRIFERALPDSINFGLGEPDLPTPEFLREEAARVAVEEQNGYTNHAELLPLRKKIAAQSLFNSFRQTIVNQIIDFFKQIFARDKNLFEKREIFVIVVNFAFDK